MKAVILAGGYGTRLAEESQTRPKPMVEIGGMPILWHIMKIYSAHGVNEFIICLGYKGHMIKEYFANYFLHTSDVTFDMSNQGQMEIHNNKSEPWKVTLVNTGEGTQTGGRLKRVRDYVGDETFCFTYGDGLSNIDIQASIEFHKKHKAKATMTIVQPPGRFGSVEFSANKITKFKEKPDGDKSWVNGGFFVLDPSVFDELVDDETVWEEEPLERLAENDQLKAYQHTGFWRPMDALRDKMFLNKLWDNQEAPWKIWD